MKETRELILETAYKMFLANNYESVTINSIIHATGFTKGAIYHYFSSKEDLFKAVIDEFLEKKEDEQLADCESIEEIIAHQITKKKAFIEKRSELLCNEECDPSQNFVLQHIALSLAASKYYPEFKENRREAFGINKKVWIQVLEKGIERGELKPNIDIEIATMNLMYAEATVALYSMANNNLDIKHIMDLYERQMTEIFKSIKA